MKVPLHDGEPVTHVDHNLQRELIFRKIFDEISMNLAGPTQVPWDLATFARRTDALRPIRHSGAMFPKTTTSIDVNGGAWLQVDYAGPLVSDAAIALVGHKDAVEEVTGFVAATATTFRRDLVQARLTAVDDSPVARDFEDAVTRAVTTTSTEVRRTRAVVEYQRKAGAEYASQALADTPANEQTPDSGWFKIGSVLCDDAGLMVRANFWDWRRPWGYSRGLTSAGDFYSDAGHLTLANAGLYAEGDASALILADCPLSKVAVGAAGLTWNPVRLEKVRLIADFVGAPAASDVRIAEWDLQTGLVAYWLDAGGSVSTALAEHVLMDDATGNHPPLWSGGGTNPYATSQKILAKLVLNTAGSTDHLYGSHWEGWGGF